MELLMQKALLKTGKIIYPNNLKINKKFKIGIIGSGKMAKNYIEVIKSYNHEISAIVSLSNNQNAKKLAKRHNSKLFNNYKSAIIERDLVDAWIVCCSWDQIAKCLKFFLKTKKPLLVEKSITINSNNLNKLHKKNKKNFSKVLFAYNRNYYDFVFKLIKKIKENNLEYIEGKFFDPYKTIIKSKGRKIKRYLPYYITSHWIVFILKIIKILKMKVINVKKERIFTNKSDQILLTFKVKFKSKYLFLKFYNLPNHPKNHFIEFYFQKGHLKISPIEKMNLIDKFKDIKGFNNKYLPELKFYKTNNKYKSGIRYLYYDFINNCFFKKKSYLKTDVKDLIEAYKICEKL